MKPANQTQEQLFFFDFITYDIWGNKRDGFEVNAAYVNERDIVITDADKLTDRELIQALKRLHLINKGIHTKSLQVEGDIEYGVYFNDVRSIVGGFCPAFELRCTKIIPAKKG